MTTTCPDPARPGVPLNPEQRGWHWLSCQNMPFLVFWNGEVLQDAFSGQRIKPDVLSPVYSYLSPALTPAEVDALRAERNAERSARFKAEAEFSHMQRRIARQRRALAKLYEKRRDRKAENAHLRAERDALPAKVERPESGVSYEAFVSAMQIVTTERDALQAENARLREAFQKYFGQSEATNIRALAKEERDD